jgi:hypothetical protein
MRAHGASMKLSAVMLTVMSPSSRIASASASASGSAALKSSSPASRIPGGAYWRQIRSSASAW